MNKDVFFTSDRVASGGSIDVYTLGEDDETISSQALESGEESLVSINEELTKNETGSSEPSGHQENNYTSDLHRIRDEAMGKVTPTVTDSAEYSLDNFFEPKDNGEIELMNDAAEELDGLVYTLDFKDGEAFKKLHVKVSEDDVYETQEAFSLAIFDPTNGAETGEQSTSNVVIDDNDNVEKSDIAFALSNYQVFSDSDGVTVSLVRSGNLNDYVSVYVSTLADTALADKDYTPVMGDIMFLPGEKEKKIFVPLLKDNIKSKDIKDPIGFDITAETEDNANVTLSKTHVEILPYSNTDNRALINVDNTTDPDTGETVKAMSDDSPLEVYEASGNYFGVLNEHNMSYSSVGFPDYTESTWKPAYYRYNDLTGVEYVEVEWKNPVKDSKYKGRQKSYVGLDGWEKVKYQGWNNWEKVTFDANDMANWGMRKKDVNVWAGVYRDWGNPMDLSVRNFRAYYTNFSFISKSPNKLTVYVYEGPTEADRVTSVNFTPGRTSVSSDKFIRGNDIKASASLTSEGREYGCSLQYINITGNNKTITKQSGESFTADSDFITNYIYNGDQKKSKLEAQAVYKRTEKVNKIQIAPYENGVVKIGGKVYNNEDMTSNIWLKGDKLHLSVTPDQGYHVASITAGGKTYKQGEDISLADNMTIKVEFARDDNKVSIVHGVLGTNPTESLTANKAHGKVVSPNLISEKPITPLTKDEYIYSLSVREKLNIIHRYHIVSTLEIEDAVCEPEYPAIGEDAVIYVTAKNVGVLPSESVTFKATMTDSEGNVTDLGTNTVNTHIETSGEVEGAFTYKVPENGDDYSFSITAYEENYNEKTAKFEKSFVKAPVIENNAPQLTRTNNDVADISAAFVNVGNKTTGDMTFKVSVRNNGENAQLNEILSIPVDAIEPNGAIALSEQLVIGDQWGDGNMLRLFITLENGEETLYDEITDLHLISDTDLEVTDIIVNDGDENQIEVNAGEWTYPHFEIAPVGAANGNRLEYSISDSNIADIDPSNGSIYGKKDGTATITVTAVKKDYSLFVDEDNSIYNSEGDLMLFDENGIVDISSDKDGDKGAVMTK